MTPQAIMAGLLMLVALAGLWHSIRVMKQVDKERKR